MNEVNNKKNKLLMVIGIAILSLVVFGATYAYFAVSTISNFGTRTINAQVGGIGTVTLDGNNAQLNLSVSALDMAKGSSDITYYASSSGTTTTPTTVTIATASVSPTSDTNTYHCTYKLNVTHAGSTDMYTVFSNYANKTSGQIILTINGRDYDFNDGWPASNEVSGEFYIKGTQTEDITAGLRIINDSEINQNYLAGSDISISISLKNNTFSCTAIEPASTTLIALTGDSNNSSKISRYTGPVTDECGASTCTTVQSAQNVYVFKSNDINNVIFEDYCWKIIRTTETGGTKLLYNGLPVTNGNHRKCTATGVNSMLMAAQMNTSSNAIAYSQGGANDKPAYVGYMYNPNTLNGTYKQQLRGDTTYDVNTNDSLFKEKIEYWFSNSNIDESKLEDAVYCNDRSLASPSPVTEANLASATSGTVNFRNYSQVSTLECTNITDSFNTTNTKAQTNYKVGFMTEPEGYLMGSLPVANGQYYWLGSPSCFNGSYAFVRSVDGGGISGNGYVHGSRGVRPVVSTNTGVQITDGDGSTTSPFIFE